MANPGKGELIKTSEGYSARITIEGKERECFPLTYCRTEEEANERRLLVAALAGKFRKAGIIRTAQVRKLLSTAASCEPPMVASVHLVASELLGGKYTLPTSSKAPTFEEVATEWTSGKLAERFPDHVDKIIQEMNVLRFNATIFPLIGKKPIDTITRADCDMVMQRLPIPKGRTELSRSTRRQYAGLINRVLNLAELAGYIDRNPLPRGWLPKSAPDKRYPILYPAEDRALLQAPGIWIGFRLLYGFLHREGLRRGEAAELRFADLDLDTAGTINLDQNKTDHARFWKLAPGVARALRQWRDIRGASPADYVFTEENGGPLELNHLAERVRDHLRAAGLKRADLYSTGPLKGAFGTHCFRRSYVTRSLALGRPDDFVRARTGHTSEELLTYRQAARTVAELELGDVDSLDQSLSDLFDRPVMAHQMVGAGGFEPPTPRPPVERNPLDLSEEAETALGPEVERERAEPPSGPMAPENGPSGDRVECALSSALTAAASAGDFDAVRAIVGELEARRRARSAVVDLDAERAKRGRR